MDVISNKFLLCVTHDRHTLFASCDNCLKLEWMLTLKEAEKWKKIQNLEATESALLWLKSHNFSKT